MPKSTLFMLHESEYDARECSLNNLSMGHNLGSESYLDGFKNLATTPFTFSFLGSGNERRKMTGTELF